MTTAADKNGRVIITGGAGFIGSALAERLRKGGWEIVSLTRNPGSARLPEGVRAERWDGKTANGWGPLADGARAIVNLAGENIGQGRWTAAKKKAIAESRINAGKAVVEAVAAAKRKPEVVVQSSAVGYYGDRGDDEVDETSTGGKGFLAEVCAAWEPSTAAVEAMGVRRIIARTGVVLGRDGGMLPRVVFPFKLFAGGHQGSGRQWMSWIHVKDEVRAIEFLIERSDTRGPFNLTASNPATNAEFMRALGGAVGRPSWLPVPAFALKAVFGEMARELVLSGQRALPRRLLGAGFSFEHDTLVGALENVFKPI